MNLPYVRLLTFTLLALCGVGQVRAQARNQNSVDEFDELARVFDAAGLLNLNGKEWVIVDRGPANFPFELSGWLIEDGPMNISILDWQGFRHVLRKPKPEEKRPHLKEEAGGGFAHNHVRAADQSVAWGVRRQNFSDKSKKFLKDGLPKKDENEEGVRNVFSSVNERFGLAGHVVNAAKYAHFARIAGEEDHAVALMSHAQDARAKYEQMYEFGEARVKLHRFVGGRVASNLHNRAIFDAHHGKAPRKELMQLWERITAIPHHEFGDEAKEMVKGYKNLLEEDQRWVEPDAAAFKKLTVDQQVSYWLYHLRDLDVGQSSDPGGCYVLGEFGTEEKEGNPAVELKKLGLAAVPELIAHLDDARPTRCKAHWRSYWPEGHYLLRYGDCCQQIFEGISGETIFEGRTTVSYPINDGAAGQCKAKAEKWWSEHRPGSSKAAR